MSKIFSPRKMELKKPEKKLGNEGFLSREVEINQDQNEGG
jgi:hypothetical protein